MFRCRPWRREGARPGGQQTAGAPTRPRKRLTTHRRAQPPKPSEGPRPSHFDEGGGRGPRQRWQGETLHLHIICDESAGPNLIEQPEGEGMARRLSSHLCGTFENAKLVSP